MNLRDAFYDSRDTLRSGWRFSLFVLGFIFVGTIFGVIAVGLLSQLPIRTPQNSPIALAVTATFSLAAALLVGWICGKYLESLPFRALGAWFTPGWFVNLIAGTLLGALTLSFAVLTAYLAGGIRFELHLSADVASTISSFIFSIIVLFIAAAFEEALFRGYILQTFARSGLAWFAIILTAIFFAAVHTANPNAGVISTINTAIAGIWFGVAYLRTRDLWFVTGLHFMWNWMQGAFFGIEISGLTDLVAAPLMREIDAGPAWLTGDTYGLEGGIAATVALIASTAFIFFVNWPKADPELLAMSGPPSDDNPVSPPVS